VLTRDGKPVPDADVTWVLPAIWRARRKPTARDAFRFRPACAGGFCSKRLGSISRRGRSMAPPTTSRPWSPRLPSTGEMMAQASTPMKHSAPLPGAAFVALRGHVLAMERSFPAVGHGRTAPPPSVRFGVRGGLPLASRIDNGRRRLSPACFLAVLLLPHLAGCRQQEKEASAP
jgi:hypothetical protein